MKKKNLISKNLFRKVSNKSDLVSTTLSVDGKKYKIELPRFTRWYELEMTIREKFKLNYRYGWSLSLMRKCEDSDFKGAYTTVNIKSEDIVALFLNDKTEVWVEPHVGAAP